jgi:hypothetical protein
MALLALAALVAIFLGWTYTRAPRGPDGAPSRVEPRRATPQEVAAMRRAIERNVAGAPDYAGFFDRLRTAFPADYEGFAARAADRAAAIGETPSADALLIEAARTVRQSHGILAAEADGPALDRFFQARRAVIEELSRSNATLCIDFLYGGGAGDFASFSRDHRGLFAAMANAGLDAIADGQVKRTEREPPNDADFRTLENALRAQGVSNAAIAALLDGKLPNPPLEDGELCDAGRVYLQTLAALPDAARLRIYGFAVKLMAHS